MVEDGPREITFADLEFKVDGPSRQQRGQDTAPVVAYLKGHSVAQILDDWVGPFNWHDEYRVVTMGGVEMIACQLSVRWEPGDDWITKSDVGSYSRGFGDKGNSAKGGVSDAFKRVASRKWGVGRRVYDLPRANHAPVKVDRWQSQGEDKERVTITPQTIEYIRNHYAQLHPWLQGKPEIVEIHEDADEPPEQHTASPAAAGAPSAPSERPAPATPPGPSESEGDIRKTLAAKLRSIPAADRAQLGADLEQRTIRIGREEVPMWPILGKQKMDELGTAKVAHWAAHTMQAIDEWVKARA